MFERETLVSQAETPSQPTAAPIPAEAPASPAPETPQGTQAAAQESVQPQVVEQPTVPTAPAPAVPEVPEPVKPRTYTEDEWRRRQSAYDRQMAELQRRDAENQARLSQQAMEAQVEAYRRQMVSDLVAQNYEPGAAQTVADRAAQSKREALSAQAELNQIRTQGQRQYVESEMANATALARQAQSQFGLEQEDVSLLMAQITPEAIAARAINPEGWWRYAEHLGALRKAAKGGVAKTVAKVPPGIQVGVQTETVGKPSDTDMLQKFNSGDRSPEVRKFMNEYMNRR